MLNKKIPVMFKIIKIMLLCLWLVNVFNPTPAAAQEVNCKEIYQLEDASKNGAAYTYPFFQNALYRLNTQMGYISDIALQEGDLIKHIACGDSSKYMVDYSVVGNIAHVYIKPLVENAATNLIINTSLRSYRLLLSEGDSYYPIINWSFAQADQSGNNRQERIVQDSPGKLTKKNFNYKVSWHGKWRTPKDEAGIKVFDDGEKTYIFLSEQTMKEVPLIYKLEGKKLILVNYRIKNNEIIIDTCMDVFRLIFNSQKTIDIVAKEKA